MVERAGSGRAGHSLDVAVWSLPQVQQWGSEVGKEDESGLLFPLRAQLEF